MTTEVVRPGQRTEALVRGADPSPPDRQPLVAVGPGASATVASGAAVAEQAVEHLVVARTPEVAAADPWTEAGRKVIRFHLARMLVHVPGVVAGEDPEAVHDMRVAGRRIRAAWRVFGPAYDRAVVRERTRELRSLGSRLGAVRDLDVQLALLTDYRDHRSKRDRAGLAPLVDAWTVARAARHRELADHLGSPWFAAFVAGHEAFVTADAPVPAEAAVGPSPATVRLRTPAVTWDAYAAVWAFDRATVGTTTDVAVLHELRIAAKWLRYTLEFVREPMEPLATELIRRVVVLQDQLGDIHDLQAVGILARHTLADGPEPRPAARRAVERFIDAEEARLDRLRGRLGPAWRGVSDPEFRRGLGRALARL